MILDQMSQCLWQYSRMWSTDSASTRQIGQFDSELPNIPLRTNIQRVLILLMIAIQQKISTFGGTIPFQIPANEKAMFVEGFGLNNPQRDFTENLPELLSFHISLSSPSLSMCTADRIAYS